MKILDSSLHIVIIKLKFVTKNRSKLLYDSSKDLINFLKVYAKEKMLQKKKSSTFLSAIGYKQISYLYLLIFEPFFASKHKKVLSIY